MEKNFEHEPVLLKEAVAGLIVEGDGIYIDATFGRGGHSREILNRVGPDGCLIALDKDPEAIEAAKVGSVLQDTRFSIEHVSFDQLISVVEKRGLVGKISGVLLDLGVSSPQLDNPERGFSFKRDGPLDMRMNCHTGTDAATWIQHARVAEITQVLRDFGEERFAHRIARAIDDARTHYLITRTKELADIIAKAVPHHDRHRHPATKSFQAIRILINDELGALQRVLPQVLKVLKVGGRLVVMSFHSLEDRIVKRFIQKEMKGDEFPLDLPVEAKHLNPRLRRVGSLITPHKDEITRNPRARSVRLRIAEKLA